MIWLICCEMLRLLSLASRSRISYFCSGILMVVILVFVLMCFSYIFTPLFLCIILNFRCSVNFSRIGVVFESNT